MSITSEDTKTVLGSLESATYWRMGRYSWDASPALMFSPQYSLKALLEIVSSAGWFHVQAGSTILLFLIASPSVRISLFLTLVWFQA